MPLGLDPMSVGRVLSSLYSGLPRYSVPTFTPEAPFFVFSSQNPGERKGDDAEKIREFKKPGLHMFLPKGFGAARNAQKGFSPLSPGRRPRLPETAFLFQIQSAEPALKGLCASA